MYALYRLSTSIKLKQVRSILSAAKRDMSLWPPLNLPIEFPALYDSENWWQEVDYNDNVLFGVLDQACLTPCSGQLRMDNLLRVSKAPTYVSFCSPVMLIGNLSIISGNFTKIKPISKTRRENVPAALSSKGSESAHEICLSQLLQQYYNLLYTTKVCTLKAQIFDPMKLMTPDRALYNISRRPLFLVHVSCSRQVENPPTQDWICSYS